MLLHEERQIADSVDLDSSKKLSNSDTALIEIDTEATFPSHAYCEAQKVCSQNIKKLNIKKLGCNFYRNQRDCKKIPSSYSIV